MAPWARISSAIELLDAIDANIASRGLPADAVIQAYFRDRRYAGSGDRRAITHMVYSVLRDREALTFRVRSYSLPQTVRSLLLVWLLLEGEDISAFGHEGRFAPSPFSDREAAAAADRDTLRSLPVPEAAAFNIPGWALAGLTARFGAALAREMSALNKSAPTGIRGNISKGSIAALGRHIEKELEGFEATRWSKIGFSSSVSQNIVGKACYKGGLIEIQDEAAQIAALLVDTGAGKKIIDLCAGAGGKSLLLSALMKAGAQLHAFDISNRRLQELTKRARRAGAGNITVSALPPAGEERDAKLHPHHKSADAVILDVPCSGSGTWRRSPDLRWRFDREALDMLRATQRGLLEEARALTKPGGRVYYMTCSLLPVENEDAVSAFLDNHRDWQAVDYRDVWKGDYLSADKPVTVSRVPEFLQLTPDSHGTDGFFIAVLEHRA